MIQPKINKTGRRNIIELPLKRDNSIIRDNLSQKRINELSRTTDVSDSDYMMIDNEGEVESKSVLFENMRKSLIRRNDENFQYVDTNVFNLTFMPASIISVRIITSSYMNELQGSDYVINSNLITINSNINLGDYVKVSYLY